VTHKQPASNQGWAKDTKRFMPHEGEVAMETEHQSKEKIDEALKVLEAAAREKKDDLQRLVADKYVHLRDALGSAEHSVLASLAAVGKRTLDETRHAKDVSVETIRKAGIAVDDHVHANPWPYIGGAALTGLMLGYILGRKK